MVFFGLDNIGLSADRVLIRAKEGGHYVDPLTLRENFYGNLERLNHYFPLFDSLEIVDTSEAEHHVLAVFNNGNLIEQTSLAIIPNWFFECLPLIAKKLSRKV